MKLRKNIKYYLIFMLIFILGASSCAAIHFAYDIDIVRGANEIVGDVSNRELSLRGYLLYIAEEIKPMLLVFLASFTIYACAVSAAASLYIGGRLGILLISYARSGLNPFTHGAALVFFLAGLCVATYLSTASALYRSTLKQAAPDPAELFKRESTKELFSAFISAGAAAVSFGTALYFFVVFFPL